MDFVLLRLRHVSNSDSKMFTHATGALQENCTTIFLLLQDLNFLCN